jgi:hypothetical protein
MKPFIDLLAQIYGKMLLGDDNPDSFKSSHKAYVEVDLNKKCPQPQKLFTIDGLHLQKVRYLNLSHECFVSST